MARLRSSDWFGSKESTGTVSNVPFRSVPLWEKSAGRVLGILILALVKLLFLQQEEGALTEEMIRDRYEID